MPLFVPSQLVLGISQVSTRVAGQITQAQYCLRGSHQRINAVRFGFCKLPPLFRGSARNLYRLPDGFLATMFFAGECANHYSPGQPAVIQALSFSQFHRRIRRPMRSGGRNFPCFTKLAIVDSASLKCSATCSMSNIAGKVFAALGVCVSFISCLLG